jgi:NAD(P) transhydrogenase subunit alpha
MSVTNAISSVIVVVALDVVFIRSCSSEFLSLIAIFLTIINIVGGFELTRRMLAMFSRGKGHKEASEITRK